MNRAKFIFLLALTACIVLLMSFATQDAAESAETVPGIHLISSDSDRIVLDLVVGDYTIDTTTHDGATFHSIQIADMELTNEPGLPQLPSAGVMLGVPTAEGVSVRIVAEEVEEKTGFYIEPAPAYQRTNFSDDPSAPQSLTPVFMLNAAHYATDAMYPAAPVIVADTGYLRDQAFAQIQFNPFQYNAVTGELRVSKTLRVELTWDANTMQVAPTVVAPEFERTLAATLLNYEALDRPQSAEKPANVPAPLRAPQAVPTALNVRVQESGIYQITRTDFTNAGIDPAGIDPRTIKLHNRGIETRVRVTGESDGSFDPGDKVIFYGEAYEDEFTRRNNYVVTWGGFNGQRMSTVNGAPSGATIAQRFSATHHAEVNSSYWWDMPNGHDQDHWFWNGRLGALVSGIPATRDYTVVLPPIADSNDVMLRVELKGYTSANHGTRIYINGNLVDSQIWSGQISFVHNIALPNGLLLSGNNTIKVEAYDGGTGSHQFYVNWIEIDYHAAYKAENDVIAFEPPDSLGTVQFELTNFTASTIEMYDVTDTNTVKRVTNGTTTATGSTWRFNAELATTSKSEYYALTTAKYKTPAAIEGFVPTNWQSTTNGADYIIITPTSLIDEVDPLAVQRTVDGLRVAVVEIAAIYNEFNFGIPNPQAVRDFLTYAYDNWVQPAPLYVVLAGDATYDYKNNLNLTTFREYVPTKIIEADKVLNNEGQAPSDNWLVSIVGSDILPDMYIGRIPSSDPVFFSHHVEKIIDYTVNPPDSSWNSNALFVADDDTVINFEQYSESVQAHLPANVTANRIYAGDYLPGINETRDIINDIIDTIDAGSLMVHYTGHGNVERWGSWLHGGNFWHRNNVSELNNTGKYTFVTIGDCLNGYFISVDNLSMSEAFVREQDAGAVAVWAPSWLGYSTGHTRITEDLYDALFTEDLLYLGEATTAAKYEIYGSSTAWSELVETYILFGDPYTQLGAPIDAPKVTSTDPANGATGVALDKNVSVTFDREMDTDSVTLTGAPGITFTPSWDADNKTVTFTHNNFTHSSLLTLTVNGNDRFGIPVDPATNTWSFTVTTDTVVPDVTVGVEGGALVDVALDASIIMTFTEIVRTSTVEYTISPPVAGQLVWENLGSVAVFQHPLQAFDLNETYTFTVLNAVDLAGNEMATPRSVTFTTTNVDTVPPQVEIEVEGGQTDDVPLDATIIMTFSEQMNTSSVFTTLSPSVPGTISWDATEHIATFTPDEEYAPNQAYAFTVDAGEDLAGNQLLNTPVRLDFTTINPDDVAPTVSFDVSGGDPTQTALDALLELTFSEPMNTASITLQLTPNNAGVPSRSWSGTQLTLNYPIDFAPAQAYTLQVNGTDLAGNALTGQTLFSFTTVSDDATPPTGVMSIVGDPPLDAVPTTAQILVSFSEPMNTATVVASFDPNIPFASGWNDDKSVMTLTPVGGMSLDTTYTVEIAAGAEDVAGNAMTAPIVLTFTTETSSDSNTVYMPIVIK